MTDLVEAVRQQLYTLGDETIGGVRLAGDLLARTIGQVADVPC